MIGEAARGTRTKATCQGSAAAPAPAPRRRTVPSGYLVVLTGFGLRALLQAGLTILVARLLSKADYGASVAITGASGFFAVWAGLGASVLHLRDVATSPTNWHVSFARRYRRVMLWQLPLIVLSSALSWLVTEGKIDLFTLILLSAGEILGTPTAEFLTRTYQGRSRYVAMTVMMCLLPMARLAIFGAQIWGSGSGAIELRSWGITVFTSGLAFSVAAFAMAHRWRVDSKNTLLERNSLSGAAFAVSAASNRIHSDADKVILARLSTMELAGEYSLAYRLVDMLLIPVISLIEWSARVMFVHGQRGVRYAMRALWRRWAMVIGLSILASAIAYLIAPLLPLLFGARYVGAVEVARWLSLLPFTTACWASVRTLSATSGREKAAASVEVAGALVNIGLCMALISAWDWRGAILATYITHLVMSVGCILILRIKPLARVG